MSEGIVTRLRTIATQRVQAFTGEGAYHGSTRPRPTVSAAPPPLVEEMRPTTLEDYAARGQTSIVDFDARFPNHYAVCDQLSVPAPDAIARDGVTFCWAPFVDALAAAGPLTRRVLLAMEPHLRRDKRFVYVDSKIQWFEPGDIPVDSQHWHVDGTIAVRDERVQALGHRLLHDLRARLDRPAPPTYLAYQSSTHCATQFATEPVTVRIPELVPNFDELDARVRALGIRATSQTAASIVAFDGRSLHRAVAATDRGWRLWIRCSESDHEVRTNPALVDCYGTVFRR